MVRRWLRGIVGGNGGEGEIFVSSHGGVLLQITCIGKKQNLGMVGMFVLVWLQDVVILLIPWCCTVVAFSLCDALGESGLPLPLIGSLVCI